MDILRTDMSSRMAVSQRTDRGVERTGHSFEYVRDLLMILIGKEIKVRYKNSWLGYAWSIANPLFFACVYYIAFGFVMRVQVPNYPLFLIAGLFPWQWISNSMNGAPFIFLANAI